MQERTKVGFVITKGNWGGAQRYVYDMATNLPKEIFDVFVILGKGDVLRQKLTEKNIRVYELPHLLRDISIIKELRSFLSVLNIVRKEKPDILHLNSPKAAGIGAVAGRIVGVKKIIQTVHGWSWNEKRNAFSKFLITFFSWMTVHLCHRTIVLSEKEKRQAENLLLVAKEKIVLIHNGIASINFLKKEQAQAALGEISDRIWLGAISELHRNKGLEYAVRAVAKLEHPVFFCVIGEGEERARLQKLINDLGLENKVKLFGFKENASEYLTAFDIFLLPSIKEGLPYVILEAGRASLPVVATNIGGIPEIISNNSEGILVAPSREGETARAIEYLIVNTPKRKEFGENLRQKIEKEFSLEKMIEKTIKLYS